ncbi:hypothetical protein F53441_14696 [Fusarium austroafricanum]|uniref:Uncharacterized protein n=1 Tax=Fusarium austroafricanum TaxID=2364996 RepID=A0A8H4NA99_9HYPO|nr:hypothetical protein F53441_14696 [Fusarium austroafricanum]
MDVGTTLAAVNLVASVAAKLYDISSDYKAAFPELTRVEGGLRSLKEVINRLPDGSHAPLQAVLKDLSDYSGEVEAFVEKRLNKLHKQPMMVKIRWQKDRIELERMKAVLETYKSTLIIALQAQGLQPKEMDQTELMAGPQDIRAYLYSISKALEERQKDLNETQGAAAAKTMIEVDAGKPMDIQHDEKIPAEKESRGKGKEQDRPIIQWWGSKVEVSTQPPDLQWEVTN